MLTHFNISLPGERHLANEIPCQDYSYSLAIDNEKLDKKFIIGGIADGVGSCPYSHVGSKTAVETAVNFTAEKMKSVTEEDLNDDFITNIIKESFQKALEAVEDKAADMELPFTAFDSTLSLVVYDGKRIWFGHIGDDGVVALFTDGTYEMITKRHKGEIAHSLFPLRVTDLWDFGATNADKEIASFAMMTDGVLDYCVGNDSFDNMIYFPFLEPALTTPMTNEEEQSEQRQAWEEYFNGSEYYKERFRDSVTDDITLLVGENSDLVSKLPVIDFDFDQWDAKVKEKQEEFQEKLKNINLNSPKPVEEQSEYSTSFFEDDPDELFFEEDPDELFYEENETSEELSPEDEIFQKEPLKASIEVLSNDDNQENVEEIDLDTSSVNASKENVIKSRKVKKKNTD